MLHPKLKRGELERGIEKDLVEIGEALIGEEWYELQQMFDRDPVWFGGEFPAGGVDIRESRGEGSAQDRGDRPSVVEAHVLFFYPCLPVRGVRSKEQDKISEAKNITRDIRDTFLVRLFEHYPRLAAAARVTQSRGASATEFGTSRTDETENDILWVDRTVIEFSV